MFGDFSFGQPYFGEGFSTVVVEIGVPEVVMAGAGELIVGGIAGSGETFVTGSGAAETSAVGAGAGPTSVRMEGAYANGS